VLLAIDHLRSPPIHLLILEESVGYRRNVDLLQGETFGKFPIVPNWHSSCMQARPRGGAGSATPMGPLLVGAQEYMCVIVYVYVYVYVYVLAQRSRYNSLCTGD
jgi:hypothetical protein